jgi:amino acid adenylation domain-containing protein/thioester reductase-like protein
MPASPESRWPLTTAQREVWLAQQMHGLVPLAIAQFIDVRGPLDRDAYTAAGRQAARELGIYLRIDIDSDGMPWQQPEFDHYDDVGFVDLSTEPDPREAALVWMRAHQRTPLDVTVDPPLCSTVLRIGPQHHYVYTRAHHLMLDGYGAARLAHRHAELYEQLLAGAALPESEPGTPEPLLAADRAYRASERFEKDRRYWSQRAADLPDPSTLAVRPGEPAAYSVVVGTDLTPDRVATLDHAAAGAGATTVLVAAFGAYLARVSGTTEVTLTLPVAARTTAALRRTAGLVSNIVPLRLAVAATARWGELVAVARTEIGGALRHQRYRGEDIVRDVAPGAHLGTRDFGPAVNIMNFESTVDLGPAQATLHLLGTGPVPDLAFNIYPGSGNGLRIEFEANPHRYTHTELAAHHARFLRLLTHLGAGRPVGEFDLLDAGEAAALVPWHGPAGGPIVALADLIAAAVQRNPDGTAVVHGERRWTYREFDLRTDRLARELIAAGVGPETLVATVLERSAESVAAVWAVAKAGAAFVPVDPTYPQDRVDYLLADSGAGIALTTAEHADRVPAGIRVLRVEAALTEALEASPGPVTDAERTTPLSPAHPAYLIYTSGSTGRPKGVVVTHGGLANLAAERHDRFGLRPGTVTVHHASPGFDMAVGEQLFALSGSATLVVAPRYAVAGSELAELIRRERVTHAIITPAVLATLDPRDVPELKVMAVGGEAVRGDLVDKWAPGRRIRNGYGPTEATDIATLAELVAGEPVTIGAPLRGFHALVLDTRLRPVPPGVLGELYLGGPALARGYHGRPGLTAGRFVADPFGPPSGRLYRTGDLVSISAGSQPVLVYHGRGDSQIKVRGHRIEPGEIEAALTALTGIARAAVTAHTDERTGTHLVAYLVAEPDARIDSSSVRAEMARRLPSYLRPAAYEVLDTLPLTAHGKLDHRRLPAPVFGHTRYRAPSGTAEELVAAVFAEVLAVTRPVGAGDDFFALGGTSLSAGRVAARLGVPLRVVFDAPTVTELATALAHTDPGDTPDLVAGPRPDRVPLAPAQRRIWMLNRLLPDSTAYHLPVALRLTGPLDPAALATALHAVVDRHEALRTVYPDSGDSAQQQLLSAAVVAAALDLDTTGTSRDLHTEIDEFVARPFDVAVDPPIRARLLRVAEHPEEHVLVLVAHHIAADGWSLGPLISDFTAAYTAARFGTEPDWAPPPVRYYDYALWQHTLLGDPTDPGSRAARQLAYWRAVLADAPDSLPLPAPSTARHERRGHGAAVEVDLTTPVTGVAGCTPFMVALTTYAVLLHQVSGCDDMVIGTPVAGRGHPALEPVVGMFVNTVPLRVRITPDASFRDLLSTVRATVVDAFAHADVPFDAIVAATDAPRIDGGNPLLRTVLAYENLPTSPPLLLDGLRVEPLELPERAAQFDLALTVHENPPRASFRYDTAVLDDTAVTALASAYNTLSAAALRNPDRPIAELGGAGIDRPGLPPNRFRIGADPAEVVAPPAPATAREQAIAMVFAEVLGLESVGPEDDFFALGGTSLLLFALRTALAERLGLQIEPRILFDAPTARALAAGRDTVDPREFARSLRADAVLDDRFSVDGKAAADPAGPILLTGATGFLGTHLLRELLDSDPRPVYCLLRAETSAAGLNRLRAAMAEFELAYDDLPDRVTVVPGDLTRPLLGLDVDTAVRLGGRISAIVHNGAAVDHLASYRQLRNANVGGTREVLRLATVARVVPVHLVSTLDAVIGPDRSGTLTEEATITAEQVRPHGYVATKWVAEQLVRQAGARGLPVAVYRPGLIGGSLTTGAVARDDSLWTLVRAVARLGVAPDPGNAAISLIPVDHVARALVSLLPVATGDRCYHLVNIEPTPLSDLVAGLDRLGYPVRPVTMEEAQRLLADRLADTGADPHPDLVRAALLIGGYTGAGTVGLGELVLDDSRTRAELERAGITCPPIDDAAIDRHLRRFRDEGLLPPVASVVH